MRAKPYHIVAAGGKKVEEGSKCEPFVAVFCAEHTNEMDKKARSPSDRKAFLKKRFAKNPFILLGQVKEITPLHTPTEERSQSDVNDETFSGNPVNLAGKKRRR